MDEGARPRPRSVVVVLLLGLAWLGALEVAEPHYFLRDDNTTYHLAHYVHTLRTVVEHGELALLDLHQFAGAPHLAVGQSCVLYPPVYLAVGLTTWLGDVRWSIDVLVIGHLLVGAIGMLFLLRWLGRGETFAVLGAFLWLGLPYPTLISRSWLVMAYGAGFAPWAVYVFLRLVHRPSWGRALLLASTMTAFFFSGYPQNVLDVGLVQALLLPACALRWGWSRRAFGERVAKLAVATILFAALSAPLLLPMAAQARGSIREVTREDFVSRAVDPEIFLRAQIFDFGPSGVFGGESSLFHVGIPTLLLLAAALVWAPGLGRSMAVASGILLLASTPLWGVLWNVPLLSLFRWPVKHLLFFLLLLAPPVTAVLERLWSRRPALAIPILGLVLLSGPAVIALEGEGATLGTLTLERPVAELREHPLLEAADREARFVTFYGVGAERPRGGWEWSPALLTHDLASLLGVASLGGYEPLVDVAASRLLLDARLGTLPAPLASDPGLMSHLAAWNVGNVIGQAKPGVRAALLSTGMLELVTSTEGMDLYRLAAARPKVEMIQGELLGEPVWTSRRLEVRVRGPALVRVAVAPIQGWTWSADGRSLGPPPGHPSQGLLLRAGAGEHQLALAYQPPGWNVGLVVAAVAVTLILVAMWWGERRTSKRRAARRTVAGVVASAVSWRPSSPLRPSRRR